MNTFHKLLNLFLFLIAFSCTKEPIPPNPKDPTTKFEITVKDSNGKPVSDVNIQLGAFWGITIKDQVIGVHGSKTSNEGMALFSLNIKKTYFTLEVDFPSDSSIYNYTSINKEFKEYIGINSKKHNLKIYEVNKLEFIRISK
jgi:hypothetical protein